MEADFGDLEVGASPRVSQRSDIHQRSRDVSVSVTSLLSTSNLKITAAIRSDRSLNAVCMSGISCKCRAKRGDRCRVLPQFFYV